MVKVDQADRCGFPTASACIKAATACASCGWASASELVEPAFGKARQLLKLRRRGSNWSRLQRPDECCGFGGTFAVAEEAVSCMMGEDRIADHVQAGAEVLTANDMSCLMHLDGLIRRQQQAAAGDAHRRNPRRATRV